MQDYHPDFVYSYSSPNRKIKSNADVKFLNSDLYFHVWKVEEEKLNKNNEVILWLSQINYGVWYISVLIIVIVPTTIFLAVHHYRDKKTRE